MDELSAGLVVYRASRLEALLDPLAQLLDSQLPEDVLAPQTVIAAHPGMKHWLAGALARRRGSGGVVANLDIVLPSAWLDRLAQDVLGENAVAVDAYRREHLRWRIHALLDASQPGAVRDYLQGSDAPRRRFQLADRLARLYGQYIVYRSDWLQAWAQGARPPREPTLDGGLLATLWQRLRRDVGRAHRGEVLGQLAARLRDGARVPAAGEPLHVFGLSHLAPSELALLRVVATQRLVVLYLPDPCRERWAGLQTDRQRLRELVRADAFGRDAETLFLEQEHPLLAQWGRLGQHFVLALEDGDDALRLDVRHWQDEADAESAPTSRLQQVQESLRRLQPALLKPFREMNEERADASLRVHLCHTRLRELEVLRDALLRQLRDNPALRPSDIVVMAPDIKAYLPLLPAVFGAPGRHDGPLPYHLADVAVANAHPLFDAFRRMLDLPRARMSAPEVMDLAAMPDVARRFGLAPADLDMLAQWLGNARVAWALDGRFRERLGVPSLESHTFAWGVDRMLAGYLVGHDADAPHATLELPDGGEVAPLDGVHGPQAAALGALDALLVELADAHADGDRVLRASQWAQRLETRLDALFRIDTDDGHARDARALLLRFIRELATEPAHAGLDPELDFEVVREALLQRLDAAPERQQFLMGAATFCGMVPQRAIPFAVIAVIGLNEGEFPRGGEGGLDLMQQFRRLGDRDVRSDDRYLFLETLMSARTALHLSFIGEDVRSGRACNPAAPLAELMTALEQAAGVDGDAVNAPGAWSRPWEVRHPLQPFDTRYFDHADPALFSFRRDDARIAGAEPAVQATPFFSPGPATGEVERDDAIALREVLEYFRDPARQLLVGGLALRLDALEAQQLRDAEPLEARFEALDGVTHQLLIDALQTGSTPDAPPSWMRLSGMLPAGVLGETAWREECAVVERLRVQCAANSLFAQGMPPPVPLAVDVSLDGLRVRGELTHWHAAPDADWIVRVQPRRKEAQLDFRVRIAVFLEWALLRLRSDDALRGARVCLVCEDGPHAWADALNAWDAAYLEDVRAGDEHAAEQRLADLRRRVRALLAFWVEAQATPSWYFPRTSWTASEDASRAASTWTGSQHTRGERDYAPGYARLLAGERGFDAGSDDHALLIERAGELRKLIEFPPAAVAA